MKIGSTLAALTLAASFVVAPLAAHADDQKNKNDFRNLGIGAAAVAGYGLLKHNNTATILGAAGAAYSAKRYEDARHSQSQAKHRRDVRRYYRTHHGVHHR